MLSKSTIRGYAAGVDAISDEAAEYVRRALEAAWYMGADTAQMRELAIEALVGAAGQFGDMSRDLACTLYEAETGVAASYKSSAVNSEHVEKNVRYYASALNDGSEAGMRRFVENCMSQARYLARRDVNQAVIDSCGATSKAGKRRRYRHKGSASATRFARVPQGGDTCTFCAMLASRGFVYWSRETAGAFNHYHRHCRCLVVPDDGSGEVEGYDPDEWLARWQAYEEIDARSDLTGNQKGSLKRLWANSGGVLRTRADPALDYFGPAEEDDPVLLAQIKEDLKASGVSIKVARRADGENIAYGPSSTPGIPGNMDVTEGMSLSAWMHEYKHFCQDRDLGFPPFSKYLANPSLRSSMEEEAYGVEIARARDHGYNGLVEKLQELLEAEKGRLNGESQA